MEFNLELEYAVLSSREKSLAHLLIRLETPPAAGGDRRQPLVVGLAIDKSKSMYGEKIQATLEAASSLVNWLTRHDHLAITAYDSAVEVVQPLIPLTDKYSVLKKLENIRVGTSTNMSGGWLQALKAISEAEVENAFRRVILLTDGMANTGIVAGPELEKIARAHYRRGVSTTTIGFGKDFSEDVLQGIAREGGGNFYFIEGPEQAHEVFFREFGDIAALFGQGLEIKIKTAPGVHIQEVLNEIPFSLEDETLVLRPGDVRSDDVKNFVLMLEIDPQQAMAHAIQLLTAELSFYNMQKDYRLESRTVEIGSSFGEATEKMNRDVRLEVLLASSGRAMVEASRICRDRDLATARDLLSRMIKRLESQIGLDEKSIRQMIRRLKEMILNLEENLQITRKQMMAGGMDVLSRSAPTEKYHHSGYHNNIQEMELKGQLDLYFCPEIKAEVQKYMQSGYRYIIINMTELEYIDSSGIGTLIQISNWLKKRGGLMILANLQGSVDKIFQMSKLDEIFIIKDSYSEGRLYLEERIRHEKR